MIACSPQNLLSYSLFAVVNTHKNDKDGTIVRADRNWISMPMAIERIRLNKTRYSHSEVITWSDVGKHRVVVSKRTSCVNPGPVKNYLQFNR